VIHRENYRTILNHPLPVNYSKTKKQSANESREMVPKPVVKIHGWGVEAAVRWKRGGRFVGAEQ